MNNLFLSKSHIHDTENLLTQPFLNKLFKFFRYLPIIAISIHCVWCYIAATLTPADANPQLRKSPRPIFLAAYRTSHHGAR